MGKYMRKARGDAAAEVPQSTIGVRTRARTQSLQRQQEAEGAAAAGGSSSSLPPPLTEIAEGASESDYMQLRSRRLVEKPQFHPKVLQGEEEINAGGEENRTNAADAGNGSSGSGSKRVKSGSGGSVSITPGKPKKSKVDVGSCSGSSDAADNKGLFEKEPEPEPNDSSKEALLEKEPEPKGLEVGLGFLDAPPLPPPAVAEEDAPLAVAAEDTPLAFVIEDAPPTLVNDEAPLAVLVEDSPPAGGVAAEDAPPPVVVAEDAPPAVAVVAEEAPPSLVVVEDAPPADADAVEEALLGEENNVDAEIQDRCTREMTPPHLMIDPDSVTLPPPPGSMKRQQIHTPPWSRNVRHDSIPSWFWDRLEEDNNKEVRQFIEKYNFDVVNDKPLPGRFEWKKMSP